MPLASLGKRTRATREPDCELLDTRKRRRVQTTCVDIKKEDVTSTIYHEEQENQLPADEFASSIQSTPSKRHSKQSLLASPDINADYTPVTPQTPRHYDAFAKSVTTPRHRVMSVGKVSKRLTPRTPVTPSSSQTVYHLARQVFSRSSDPGQLIGREAERSRLREFFDRCTSRHPSGCIYVSGPPGTGKSAMVHEVCQEVASKTSYIRKAYINCMSIKSSKDLYNTLIEELGLEAKLCGSESLDASSALQRVLIPRGKTNAVFLVVLDEIDHIVSLDLESLYRMFEWSLQKSSRLVLVGIANALDLTDRFLPRLKSRNLKPELLPFLPYTAAQIKNVLTTKLKDLLPKRSAEEGFVPFFHPAAIELCSRKVSTQTGDLRRAFEICRRAIDLVESETRMKYENEIKEQVLQMSPSRKVLGENSNLATSGPSASQNAKSSLMKALQSLTVENAPRVSIGHLNKVTAAVFGNGTTQRLKTLNLQQKAALCALVAMEKRNRAAAAATASLATPTKSQVTAPTVKALFEAYCVLCKRDSLLHPLSSSEFREVIGSLETLSLIAAVDGRTGSLTSQTPRKGRNRQGLGCSTALGDDKRVASCVGDKEMELGVEGLGADILKSILSGEALD